MAGGYQPGPSDRTRAKKEHKLSPAMVKVLTEAEVGIVSGNLNTINSLINRKLVKERFITADSGQRSYALTDLGRRVVANLRGGKR